jgi:Bcr/CflA subfamily drug resistance transporter
MKNLASRSLISIILILAPQIFTFAFAMDIYVPSIPEILSHFHVDQAIMQLTVTAFVLMSGIGQLILGPIADQIGRRKIILTGICTFIIGSLLCAIAPNIGFLIFARVVQGIGACGMSVATFAIVRDLFSGNDCAKVYSFLNSTIALSPLFAPIIGGYIAYWISWRASFTALALMGLAVFISSFINVNETLDPANKRIVKTELITDYCKILKSPSFLIYTFCAGAGIANFLTFFSSSPYIIIDLLKIPKQHFGFYFAVIGILFFIGSLVSGHCAKRFGVYKTVLTGTVLMLISGLSMLWWYWQFGLTMFGFMGPILFMSFGGAMLMGGGAGGAVEPFPEMAGTASALFGSLQLGFALLSTQFVLFWQITSTAPLGYSLTILGIATLGIMLISSQRLQKTCKSVACATEAV